MHAQRNLLKKRVLHLLGVFRSARHPEQHKADDEQHRDAADAESISAHGVPSFGW